MPRGRSSPGKTERGRQFPENRSRSAALLYKRRRSPAAAWESARFRRQGFGALPRFRLRTMFAKVERRASCARLRSGEDKSSARPGHRCAAAAAVDRGKPQRRHRRRSRPPSIPAGAQVHSESRRDRRPGKLRNNRLGEFDLVAPSPAAGCPVTPENRRYQASAFGCMLRSKRAERATLPHSTAPCFRSHRRHERSSKPWRFPDRLRSCLGRNGQRPDLAFFSVRTVMWISFLQLG